MGVTQGAVAHWLGGRREPSLEKISALLEYLGLASVFRENGAPSPAQRPLRRMLSTWGIWRYGVMAILWKRMSVQSLLCRSRICRRRRYDSCDGGCRQDASFQQRHLESSRC
ncbi:helix-turn-helix domain-containing protein [Pseudomonas sp. NIBR-H-19]|uniref:helix-turn-helix domain-containing protein n=1 Tax=Pseudomonas sp. NIBR-H-19 TaxID=2901380 RepID=UPI003FA68A03